MIIIVYLSIKFYVTKNLHPKTEGEIKFCKTFFFILESSCIQYSIFNIQNVYLTIVIICLRYELITLIVPEYKYVLQQENYYNKKN